VPDDVLADAAPLALPVPAPNVFADDVPAVPVPGAAVPVAVLADAAPLTLPVPNDAGVILNGDAATEGPVITAGAKPTDTTEAPTVGGATFIFTTAGVINPLPVAVKLSAASCSP